MSAEPLFHALSFEEWKNVTRILNYSEVKVLYYLLSQNPLGRNRIDCRIRTVAEEMGLSIGAVSKALKKLEAKGLIDEVTITRAEINIKPRMISDRAREYLRKHDSNSEYLVHEIVSPSEHAVSPSEHAVSPSEHPLYIKESKRGSKTTSTSTAAVVDEKIEGIKFAPEEEVSAVPLIESEKIIQVTTECDKKTQEDNCSAAPDELLERISKIAYDWRQRPWMASAYDIKPEVLQAIWQTSPTFYSLENSNVPNAPKIRNIVLAMDRRLKALDSSAIEAYRKLSDFWSMAKAISNPEINTAFAEASQSAKKQSQEVQRQRRVQADIEMLKKEFGHG